MLKPGGQLVICDAGKANWLHGLAGRIWMSTVVQWMALCYQEEGSPGKAWSKLIRIMEPMDITVN